MQPRLAASDLACRRGERMLFRRLSLALEPGEVLQVAGPNGVGKTSLIRILAGLLTPLAGTVSRAGCVALLDGRSALDPQLPLARALAFWGDLDGHGGVRTGAHAERLGLGDLAEVPVRYLSTGQTKRAGLARLLGQEAAIWLLDEPLNGLDAEGAALVEELLQEHRASGGIAVVASHQQIVLPDAQILELARYSRSAETSLAE